MRFHATRITPLWAGLLLLLVLYLDVSPSQAQDEGRNVAAAVNGGLATATSQYNGYFQAAGATNGSHAWNNGDGPIGSADAGWCDGNKNVYPDTIAVTFIGPKTISTINVVGLMDSLPNTPTLDTVGTLYNLVDFDVEYLDSADGTYKLIPGGQVRGNNKVWRQFTFTVLERITTTQIRVTIYRANSGWSRVAELEAWEENDTTPAAPVPSGTNVARSAIGATATASSTATAASYSFNVSSVMDGDRSGRAWRSDGAWADATGNAYPDWVEVAFPGERTIHEVDVFTLQDYLQNAVEPTPEMRFKDWGIVNFQVQYWDGSAWLTAPGGTVTNNDLVWRRVVLTTPVTTSKIRINVTSAMGTLSRITEIECWADNARPTASLISPAEGATLTPGYETTLEAAALDTDGTISKVEFYATLQSPLSGACPYDTMTLIGSGTYDAGSGRYILNWVPTVGGAYWVYIVASDNIGGTNNSLGAPGAPPVNQSTRVSVTVTPNYPGVYTVEDAGSLYSFTSTGLPGNPTIQIADVYGSFSTRYTAQSFKVSAALLDEYSVYAPDNLRRSASFVVAYTHAVRITWQPKVAGESPPKKILLVRYLTGGSRARLWETEYYDGSVGYLPLATASCTGFPALTMTVGMDSGNSGMAPSALVTEVELGTMADGSWGAISSMSDVVTAEIHREGKIGALASSSAEIWVHSINFSRIDGSPRNEYGAY